jgi:hypothetical protein
LIWTGLSTDIEGNARNKADGSELFFATTALMASGTRTILLSRWRVGGKSTIELTREFAIDLNRGSPASAAWQRSVELFRRADLDLESEPRVRPVELEQPLTGDPPFFWAGYLLVDDGGQAGAPAGETEAAPPQTPTGETPPEDSSQSPDNPGDDGGR